MAIHFTQQRWQEIRKTYALWWEHKLDRPLLKLTIPDAYPPDRPEPSCPLLTQENCHDFSYSAEEIVDRIDYELSQAEFVCDGFPFFNLDAFGPGVLAAFCGAKLDNSSGRVWFFADETVDITDLHIQYDPNNRWAMRIKDIYRAAFERWHGMVLVTMPDLGGVLDVLATFRESETLLFDLYDYPEEVDRLRKEIEVAWDAAYQDLAQAMRADEYGYSDWDGLFSATPSYVIQCDFSYMIGGEQFEQFVLPSLQHHMKVLDHTIYHLDGIGELKHLDTLLAQPELDAIQWVAGAGQPSAAHWLEVYQRIQSAHKGSHIVDGLVGMDSIYSHVPHYLYCNGDITKDELPMAEKYL